MWVLVQVLIPYLTSYFLLTIIGRWAIEVAHQYPHARIIGIDLAPIQPRYVPANCEFIVADAMHDLLNFYDGHTDMVHSR